MNGVGKNRFSGLIVALAMALLLSGGGAGFGQHILTVTHSDEALRNVRFKAVKSMSVGIIIFPEYPDRERLERFAKAEVRRLLPGVAYKAKFLAGEELERASRNGSHLDIYVKVTVACSPDPDLTCTGGYVHSSFNVSKDGAKEDAFPGFGKTQDVTRTQAECVIGVSRQHLTTNLEKGITRTLEVLADGFFESR